MFVHCSRAGSRSRGLGLMAAAFAAGLALSAPGARAQTGASLDVQAANNALTAEQFVAQFYNANSGKPYLTGTVPVSPAPGTPAPAVNYPPAGTTTPDGPHVRSTSTVTGS